MYRRSKVQTGVNAIVALRDYVPLAALRGQQRTLSLLFILHANPIAVFLQEEDRIIVIEVNTLKKLLQDRTLVGKRLREFLIRLVYVEMLGHDASFGYMKTVEVGCDRGWGPA